jgi:Cu/Ag efflux protein CusF
MGIGLIAGAPLGCGKGEPPAAAAREGVRTASYTVRGRVTMLPDPAKPASELMVFHEEIPAFRNPDGSLGMRSMNMAFAPAPGLSLSGVRVGDPVEITFEVLSDEASGRLLESRTTRVEPLPAGTPLDLPG